MRHTLPIIAMLLPLSAPSQTLPPMVQIHEFPAPATALVDGIALLADSNGAGVRAVSATGTTHIVTTGSVNDFQCESGNCWFAANQDNLSGRLWRTDGTPLGTQLVYENSTAALVLIAVLGGRLYLQIGGLTPRLMELSAAGQRTLFDGWANTLAVSNETAVFSANINFGRMLRIDRDGTLTDLGPYSANTGTTRPAIAIGDTVLFSSGRRLWRHQSGDAGPIEIPGPQHSDPELFTRFGDLVYLRSGARLRVMAPPYMNSTLVPDLGGPSRLQLGAGGLAIVALDAGGFQNAFLVRQPGASVTRLSSFIAGSFEHSPFTSIFGFVGAGVVFGANATVSGPVSISLGREPYYSEGLDGQALLLADLASGLADSNPRNMASDGQRAVFSAGNVWLVGAPLRPVTASPPVAVSVFGQAGRWVLCIVALSIGLFILRQSKTV